MKLKVKQMFLRFWRSENEKVSLIRDVSVALFAVLIILMGLWAYTGQWFSAPMVAIESGSMMHENEPFGRLGTIDAGDMVLLVKVNEKDDIVTYSDAKLQGNNGDKTYGKYGDVVIYHPMGNPDETMIIHRAMCWVDVEYNGNQKTYTIASAGIYNHSANEPLYLPELGIRSIYDKPVTPRWSHSGFITKGDNPITNPTCDQLGGICKEPVKVEWISGKARSELPWIGTINLFFKDLKSGAFWDDSIEVTTDNVPGDSMICLIILIAVLISIPITLDVIDYYKETKNKESKNEIKTK